LITTQPIERADSIARLRFSILWYIVAGLIFIASGEIGGTRPGTALFINLLHIKKTLYQRIIPSCTTSKIFFDEIGKKCPISLSPYKTMLTWLEKASFSDSRTVWITPWIMFAVFYMLDSFIFIFLYQSKSLIKIYSLILTH